MKATSVRHPAWHALAAAMVLAFAYAGGASAATAGASSGIAWQRVASDVEVDKAFALGRLSGKPVFLYWGAVWCPPCNQVKATLFSRSDFIERSRAFIPVYVDGDKPGAQKVAARFKVQGYPTMILFKPDGTEITRLPGEVDPQRYLLTLTAGLNAQEPVRELVRKALSKQQLSAEQWRLLAFYSWDTDEQQVFSTSEVAQRLAELALIVPATQPEVRDRIALKALAAGADTKAPSDPAPVEAGRRLVDRIIAEPQAAREVSDILVGQAARIVKHVAPAGDVRRALAGRWDVALSRLLADSSLSKGDRVDALDARIAMWKLMDDSEQLGAERRGQVLQEVARLVATTTDRYERQAVVPGAAHVLAAAGLFPESDELLKLELPRAVAPYYHMLGLASNAKKRNDVKSALYWYEQAWRKSEGPATRLQWGTGLIGNLVELAPEEVARVEAAALSVIGQLEPKSETFYGRNQRSLKRMASRLVKWQGSDTARTRTVEKVKQQLAKTCNRLPAGDMGRTNCDSVFTPASS